MQVVAGSSKHALVAPLLTLPKSGYLYVYVSNESPQDVYFDNLTVSHNAGPLVQEQSFYPYGLQMFAISDKAALKANTPYKYNAGCELEEDGLDYYNTFYRKYDAQIGRFTGVDILAEVTADLNPYQFGNNNPVMFNDPMGDFARTPGGKVNVFTKGPDGNRHIAWYSEMLWNSAGFFDWGEDGFGGGGGGGQGSGSGIYYNALGISSASVLSKMNFGDRFGWSKSRGEYGFWRQFGNDNSSSSYYNTGLKNDNDEIIWGKTEGGVEIGRVWESLQQEGGQRSILFVNPDLAASYFGALVYLKGYAEYKEYSALMYERKIGGVKYYGLTQPVKYTKFGDPAGYKFSPGPTHPYHSIIPAGGTLFAHLHSHVVTSEANEDFSWHDQKLIANNYPLRHYYLITPTARVMHNNPGGPRSRFVEQLPYYNLK